MSENEFLPKGKDLEKAKELNEKDRFRLHRVYEDVDKAIKLYGMSTYDAERIRDHVSYAFNISTLITVTVFPLEMTDEFAYSVAEDTLYKKCMLRFCVT